MGNLKVEAACRSCDNSKTLSVDRWAYYEWLNRSMLAQDAFPDLEASDRELMISGTCPQCWDNMFSEEDELFGSDAV